MKTKPNESAAPSIKQIIKLTVRGVEMELTKVEAEALRDALDGVVGEKPTPPPIIIERDRWIPYNPVPPPTYIPVSPNPWEYKQPIIWCSSDGALSLSCQCN